MKSKKNSILIIIPTYNERININLIINKIKRSLTFNYNILFIDDNSNDGTQEILKKIKNKNLVIFDDFVSEIKKTKEMNIIIKKFDITNSLIILDKISKDKIEKSIRNIPNIKVTDVNHFSAFDIVKFKKVVFTESSVKELEKRYS